MKQVFGENVWIEREVPCSGADRRAAWAVSVMEMCRVEQGGERRIGLK